MADLNDLILKILATAKSSLNLSEIQAELHASRPGLNRRSLQRAVLELVETGQISRHGSGPATKYSSADQAKIDDHEGILLSKSAERQLAYLSLPLIQRTPVTYRDELLFGYVPNRDFYPIFPK